MPQDDVMIIDDDGPPELEIEEDEDEVQQSRASGAERQL